MKIRKLYLLTPVMKRSPLLVVFITIFIDLLGFGIIIPILPNYTKDLGATALEVGLIAGVYSLMNFFFSPFWGTLSDRFGRKPIILISILITASSYFLFSFSNTLALVFLSRFLAGIGSANISTVQACVADISKPENRTKMMGIIGAAFGLGFIFGPPVGGFVKHHYGIEWVGYIAMSLCIINFVMAFFLLPETIKEKNPEASFALHPFKELRGAFRKELIRDLFFINFLYITAFAAMQITIPLLWKNHYHITDEGIGYIFMFIGIASASVQAGMIGWLNKNFGERRLLISGAVMMMIALALVPIAPQNLFIPMLALIIILISVANGCITPTLTSLISKNSAATEQGQMLGLNMSFASLARVVGPAFGGFVYDFDFTLPYFIGAAIMMCAWIFAVRVLNLKDGAGMNNGSEKNMALDSEMISAEAK